MTRPLRIEYPGAWYHVMNRGTAKQVVFHNLKSYQLFLDLLSEAHDRYQIQIHAYCLMENHYHLLIHTPFPNLGKAMRHIDGLYTVRNNRMIKRDGPLFRGRYKAILVDVDNYLLQLSRYIHLNPVDAKIVKFPEEYTWSSYKYFSNGSEKPSWLYCEETLRHFTYNRIENYKKFIMVDKKEQVLSFEDNPLPIIGTEDFIRKITKEQIKAPRIPEITEHSKLLKRFSPTMKEVVKVVNDYFNNSTNFNENEKEKMIKKIAIYLCCRIAHQSQKSVALEFEGLSSAAVSKICQRVDIAIKNDSTLRKEISEIKYRLSNVQTISLPTSFSINGLESFFSL